ncbi:MAG TPA: hypothetical protein VFJ95_05350 [Gammaproteobacteria bacterium]|nr:hypothetical protein [Gammaproteobacteria bacterium]
MYRAIEDARLEATVLATRPVEGLASGSALLRVGDTLCAVHDDAFMLTRIALPTFATSHCVLDGDGAPLPKSEKPDFESALIGPDGLIYLLGSGGAPPRCRIARLAPDASAAIAINDRPELYRCVGDALGTTPNVEGAIVEAERLRLFHRGTGAAPSATVDVPLGALRGEPPRALNVERFHLGELDGIPLSFTDAAALADGRCAFVATAEDTDDPLLDGPVAGSVIGVLEGRVARWTTLRRTADLPFREKVEGLAIDADRRGGWILTDADDPARPALLGRIALAGFGLGA